MKNPQKGQSSFLGLVFILILALTFFWMYDSAQMLSERQQAKIFSDHTAHNVATKQARLLNMNAYINRAQIANELAIAQSVSIAGWGQYSSTLFENLGYITIVFPGLSSNLQEVSNGLEVFSEEIGKWIAAYGFAVAGMEKAQSAMNNAAWFDFNGLPQKYADKNGGKYKARYIWQKSADGRITRNFPKDTIESYNGDKRKRMANVITSSKNGFLNNREWNSWYVIPSPDPVLSMLPGQLRKRGGTELVGLDQWKSTDTMSLHYRSVKFCFIFPCGVKWREMPVAYGSASASKDGSDSNSGINNSSYGGSKGENSKATRKAQQHSNRPSWDVRTSKKEFSGVGIPDHYELNYKKAGDDPVFGYAIEIQKAVKDSSMVNTNNGLQVGDTLKPYNSVKDKSITALGRSEVYFQKEWVEEYKNGKIIHEKGSLYSPYWQVRLQEVSDDDRVSSALTGSISKWF